METRIVDIMQDALEKDQEIDLRVYFRTIVKRKGIFSITVLTFLVLGVAWNFIVPSVYEITAFIEPPLIGSENGIQIFEPAENIAAMITSGALEKRIIREINAPWEDIKIRASVPKNTRFIKLALTREKGEIDLGVKFLSHLVNTVNQIYAIYINNRITKVDNEIKIVSTRISNKENEIALNNEQYKILVGREQQLLEEIRRTRTNSEKTIADRQALLKKEGKEDVASLLYTVTVQQNIAYFNQLQNEFSELKVHKEQILNNIETAKNNIRDLQVEIANLNLSKSGIRSIALIQEPFVSARPVSPKKIKNIFFAAFTGLLIALFLVFFIEYRSHSVRLL